MGTVLGPLGTPRGATYPGSAIMGTVVFRSGTSRDGWAPFGARGGSKSAPMAPFCHRRRALLRFRRWSAVRQLDEHVMASDRPTNGSPQNAQGRVTLHNAAASACNSLTRALSRTISLRAGVCRGSMRTTIGSWCSIRSATLWMSMRTSARAAAVTSPWFEDDNMRISLAARRRSMARGCNG
jgi:hypothetical protein